MGIAAADYSGDGRDDLFVTNSRGQLHAVYRSRDDEPFADARPGLRARAGASVHRLGRHLGRPRPRRHARARDRQRGDPGHQPREGRQRLRCRDHRRAAPSARLDAGADGRRNGRGLAAADYDNDGDLDLAIASVGGALELLRNDGAKGNWLEVALRKPSPGAVVTGSCRTGGGSCAKCAPARSYLSSEDPRLIFGLGAADRVREIVVRYPGGRTTRIADVKADRRVVAG